MTLRPSDQPAADQPEADRPATAQPPVSSPWLDLAIRLALLGGLVAWSFWIVKPFLSPIIWGGILAVSMGPLFEKACAALGGRRKTTAALFVLVPLLVFSVPVIVLSETLVRDILDLNEAYKAGTLTVPEPKPEVKSFPIIGERLFVLWDSAAHDLRGTVEKLTPQVLGFRDEAVAFARSIATVLVILFFSLIVMAAFLFAAEETGRVLRGLSVRVAGSHGDRLVTLARDTTRSVAKGIVGVAAIQAVLAGVGCLVAGVPGAGLWTVLVLVVAIAQIPTFLILGPLVAYVFAKASFGVAILFAVWSLIVSLIDNVLKPLLLGQGVEAPMLVVFLGAIGGVISSGPMGLFVGPVVLVVTHNLIHSWAALSPAPKIIEAEGAVPASAVSETSSI